ncbi:uncharacterized protein EI90DRAFT_3069020, partial [Cantharellus anzutake]
MGNSPPRVQRGRLGWQGGFPSVVEIAIRGKVIITTNLDIDIDVVNGVQGQIVGIWADPSCALVKL